MDDILKNALEESDQISTWRRELHQVPELDLNLPCTSELIKNALKEMGIAFQTFSTHSGIIALIEGRNTDSESKTVALRADMDALPIIELADIPYASKNGNMHACGHDAHMAMLLGAAKLLVANREELCGNVKLIFQPAEEMSGGALRMIEEGVLSNPNVDVVFGQHVGNLTSELPSGHFGFYPGEFMASRDSFIITVHGKGCHGAIPGNGVDPIVIAAYIITALQTLVSREINGTDTAVLTIGAIHGGETYNIIPETVEMKGAIRCLDPTKRQFFKTRIQQVCDGVCKTMRATCTIEYEEGYPVTINNPEVTTLAMNCAKKLFSEDHVHQFKSPLMGSEDMSFFLNERPGSFWILSTSPKDSKGYPNHNPYFRVDDSLLYKGSALLTSLTLEYLNKNRR